jgi:hypothetical protein
MGHGVRLWWGWWPADWKTDKRMRDRRARESANPLLSAGHFGHGAWCPPLEGWVASGCFAKRISGWMVGVRGNPLIRFYPLVRLVMGHGAWCPPLEGWVVSGCFAKRISGWMVGVRGNPLIRFYPLVSLVMGHGVRLWRGGKPDMSHPRRG